MSGVFDMSRPGHLLAKLDSEMAKFEADITDSYAATNAFRDAYHLREWIWHDRLEHDPVLQTQIMGEGGNEERWNRWVNCKFSQFKLVREVCNGSKHFKPGGEVRGYKVAGLDGDMLLDHEFMLDDAGLYLDIGGSDPVAVIELARNVCEFWKNLFQQFPALD